MSKAAFEIDLRMVDARKLQGLANSLNRGVAVAAPVDELIRTILLAPVDAPAANGYEITSATVTSLGLNRYRARVEADVRDGDALVEAARASYEDSWGIDDWSPETLGAALYELAFAANVVPAPADVGIEVGKGRQEGPLVDRPAVPAL